VRLSPPDRKRKKTRYEIVETNVIASEIDVPQNQTPLEWILLTNISVDNAASGYEMVKWYLCRWQIEVYFRILKSGCKVEKLQLETKDRFDACLTLYMIIAWRILYMTMLARTYPSASCEIIFTEEEWKTVWLKFLNKF